MKNHEDQRSHSHQDPRLASVFEGGEHDSPEKDFLHQGRAYHHYQHEQHDVERVVGSVGERARRARYIVRVYQRRERQIQKRYSHELSNSPHSQSDRDIAHFLRESSGSRKTHAPPPQHYPRKNQQTQPQRHLQNKRLRKRETRRARRCAKLQLSSDPSQIGAFPRRSSSTAADHNKSYGPRDNCGEDSNHHSHNRFPQIPSRLDGCSLHRLSLSSLAPRPLNSVIALRIKQWQLAEHLDTAFTSSNLLQSRLPRNPLPKAIRRMAARGIARVQPCRAGHAIWLGSSSW